MSTLSPIRQPFGTVDGARLRNLGNLKNVQNALAPSTSSVEKTLKRPHDDYSNDNAENIDPVFSGASKKASKGNILSTPQKPHFVLKNAPATVSTRQILTPKKMAKKSLEVKPISFSAPAGPAGRSPKSKRVGILSRRRTGRVDPPPFGLANGAPFSIDAALSGTVSSYDATPSKTIRNGTNSNLTLSTASPSSWVFDIHEDTPEEELGNLVQHSTQTLDISSDEESKARELDLRGKENIPPEALSFVPITRRDLMTDEPRTPLGDLETSEYYVEGCDANSFIIVEGDDNEKCNDTIPIPAEPMDKTTTPTPTPTEVTNNQDIWRELLAQVEQKQEFAATVAEPPIEIWESESAKGDEPEKEEVIGTSMPLGECIEEAEQREEVALAVTC